MSALVGIERFKRELEGLDKKMRNKVLRTALRDGAKAMAKAVKDGAPKATGKLRRSVKVRAGKRKKDVISTSVIVTGGHESPMVGAIEFGTRDQAPRPFIRPGFARTRRPVLGQILGSVRAGIRSAGK